MQLRTRRYPTMALFMWLLFGLTLTAEGNTIISPATMPFTPEHSNVYTLLLGGRISDTAVVPTWTVPCARNLPPNEDVQLRWPKKYTVKANKISIIANLIEDIEIWRTKTKSRVDFNHGAVKSIIKKTKEFRSGVKYNIHPEAFLNQTTQTACYYAIPTDSFGFDPENILPDPDCFEIVQEEVINDKNTTKFECDYRGEGDLSSKATLWAISESGSSYWIPVRYETVKYDVSLGFKMEHEIWEFYEFSRSFSTSDVFDVDYECTNNTEEVPVDGDLVTKELMFINPEMDHHVEHVFNAFKKEYARHYADEKEHAFRRNIFMKTMRRVVSTNNKNLGYKLAINKFADRTPKEMERYMGLRRRPAGKIGSVPFPYTESKLKELSNDLPDEFDLRLLGFISPVKDQQDCGSCWTFGTTAAVEGALARVNGGRMKTLANQALIDCAWPFGASGCDGGSDNEAYEWMTEYGLPTEAEYGSYLNRDGICNIQNMTKTYRIRGYTDVTPLSVTALKIALINHGPLSVSVDASDAFIAYSSGIFYDIDCDQTNLGHEVALVGYGERYGETFWILKNSWGRNWGIDGFMLISARDNVCGVATQPTYVVF